MLTEAKATGSLLTATGSLLKIVAAEAEMFLILLYNVLHSCKPSCDKSSACILKPLEVLHLKCWKGVENSACIVHFRED